MGEILKNTLFSSDLISYVILSQVNTEVHGPIRQVVGQSPFQTVIGKAVLINYSNNKEVIIRKAQELGPLPLYNLIRWILYYAACNFFKNGYSPNKFISFCGFVCGMAFESKVYQTVESIELVSGPLACMLNAFTLTQEFKNKGGWESIVKNAEEIVHIETERRELEQK